MRRRWLGRWLARGALAGAAAAVVTLLLGGPIAWPFDALLNLGPVVRDAALHAPADGGARVVVLQHGLFRTAASLGRLARTLEHHGYEVLNPGYASTRAPIATHVDSLHAAIAERRARGPVRAWYFVGHSMGGLVIQDYLRRPDAVEPVACVYLGTPHRGAMLADLRKRWFLFRWTMGTTAAMELSPGAEVHRRPLPYVERSGAVVGDLGDGNAAIPGRDDGTVGVDEARLPGAAEVVLPVGHTGITVDPAVLRQVLHFLARGAFARDGALR